MKKKIMTRKEMDKLINIAKLMTRICSDDALDKLIDYCESLIDCSEPRKAIEDDKMLVSYQSKLISVLHQKESRNNRKISAASMYSDNGDYDGIYYAQRQACQAVSNVGLIVEVFIEQDPNHLSFLDYQKILFYRQADDAAKKMDEINKNKRFQRKLASIKNGGN